MSAKKQKDRIIEEWDERPASHAETKDPFSPEALTRRDSADDWGEDLLPPGPPKRNYRKTALAIGAAAAVLVLLLVVFSHKDPTHDSSAAPAVTVALVTRVPESEVPPTRLPETKAPDTRVPATNPPTAVPTAAPTATPYLSALESSLWYSADLRWYYQQLTSREKVIFDAIYQGICDFDASISLSGLACTENEMDRVLFAIRNDCPELFQQDGNFTLTTLGSAYQAVTPVYRLSQAEYDDRCRWIRSVLQQIQASFPAGGDDYDREKVIYCWIIQHCEYLDSKDSRTAAADACLCSGQARCSGYASALSLLLRSVGIPCVEILSTVEESHEWNAVKINGNWYECDVTWDDPTADDEFLEEMGQNSFICYLNLPRRLMSAHTPKKVEFSLPYATALEDNYACREGLRVTEASSDWVEVLNSDLRRRYGKGQTRFIIMVDIDSAPAPEKIVDRLTIPGSRWQSRWPEEDETRTFFIEVTER